MSEKWTAFFVCAAMWAALELYDGLAPRRIPCDGCGFYLPGCVRECGRLRRYERVLHKRARMRRLWARVKRLAGRLAEDLAEAEREGAGR